MLAFARVKSSKDGVFWKLEAIVTDFCHLKDVDFEGSHLYMDSDSTFFPYPRIL